jgi:hypothetical protein
MTVLAIQELLRVQNSFDEAKEVFETMHNLKVKECMISGDKVMVLTRDKELKYTSTIQDEASFVVINEHLNIVAKGREKIYKTDIDYVGLTLLHNDNKPIIVQEFKEGIEIIISKFNSTFLISTKDDIHGHPYNKIVLDIINRKFPSEGLDSLFNASWFNNTSWVFTLVKQNNRHELYLTSAFDLERSYELSLLQINNISTYLNLKVNRHQTVYTKEQLEGAINLFATKDINLKYVIVSNEDGNSFKIKVKHYSNNGMLTHIARCVIEHDLAQLNAVDKKYKYLVSLIRHRHHTCVKELCDLFIKNEYVRTRKMYASKVKHHPMSAAIFALKDKKIKGFYNMGRVIKPIDLLTIVEEKDHTQFYEFLEDIQR